MTRNMQTRDMTVLCPRMKVASRLKQRSLGRFAVEVQPVKPRAGGLRASSVENDTRRAKSPDWSRLEIYNSSIRRGGLILWV